MNPTTSLHPYEAIATLPIRALLEQYPATRPIVTRHGLDLCCAGGQTIAETVELHGLDIDAVIDDVFAAIDRMEH